MALTGLLFLLAYVTGLGLAVARHPLFGLYTYVAVFYLHPPSRWWGQFLPDLRWSLIAAIVTLFAAVRLTVPPERRSWATTPPGAVLILFTIWLWVQSAWALEPESHLDACILFSKYVVLYFLVYRLVDTPSKMTWFLLVNVAGAFFLGWLGTTSDSGGRLEGVGGPGIDDANTLAMHLAVIVVVGSMLILSLRGWRQIVCILAMPFILNTIILAGSRGAFLALLAGGATLIYLKPDVNKKLFYGFAALGIVLFLFLAHDMFWQRMGTITTAVEDESQRDNSAESRVALFKAQIEMAKEYPFGSGHRGTEALSRKYLDVKYLTASEGPIEEFGVRSSHNTFMTMWVEQGIPGAVMFVVLVLWGARSLRKLKQHQAVGGSQVTATHAAAVVGGCVVVLVGGLFVDYLKAEVQIWLAGLLASIIYVRIPAETSQRSAATLSVAQTTSWLPLSGQRGTARPHHRPSE
jgi:O-antigen ligase